MNFGYIDKQEVNIYELKNDYIRAKILNFGGVIQELSLFNGQEWENIVFAYDNIKDYVTKSPYFGAITGRTAGRIKGAEFVLNGKKYILDKNNGPNNLHGGSHGLSKKYGHTNLIMIQN